MGNSTLQKELVSSENKMEIVGQIATEVDKNAKMYLVVMEANDTVVFLINSFN